MYNSRPRYTRYDNYPQTIKVPQNYSGNAFTEDFIRDTTETQNVLEKTPEPEERESWHSDSFALSEEKIEETKEEQNLMNFLLGNLNTFFSCAAVLVFVY